MAGVSRAEVFKYVDQDGVVHYSNVPTDPRYKKIASGRRARIRSKPAASYTQVFIPKPVVVYNDFIQEGSQQFNIPEPLIRAVMAVESANNPAAISEAGAQGLMQLMPATAAAMGVREVFDPRQNILGGVRYLRTLANTFGGDLVLTLAAYNAGHQAVFRYMDIPPIDETQQYVRRVLHLYNYYKQQVKGEEKPDAQGSNPR
jgi:Soluble lytic murein transglycosylase and related regulatory proteins (some contain LysM/invasin domains)